MKNYVHIIISAFSGSVISIILLLIFIPFGNKTFQIEHVSTIPLRNAIYTADNEGNIIPLDFTKASEKVMNAVVNIRALHTRSGEDSDTSIPDELKDFFEEDFYRHFFGPDKKNGGPMRMGMGSGVIINKDGYIVTNKHVIEDANVIEITLYDNRNYEAKVIGIDAATDLALLHINEKDLPTIPLVNSDDVEVGDWVLAVGNPYELSSTVTAGIVSAKSRNINILKEKNAIESFIQTDAAINPGNSGGALVNLEGGLIGINTAIASPTGTYSGYGFAITSNIVGKVVEDLIRYGSVQRGYLGIVIRNVDGNFAKERGLKTTEGAYIDSILREGAADIAGIEPGDIITQMEGRPVRQSSQLQEYIAQHNPGDEIKVTVNRKGTIKEFNAFLQNSEGTMKVAAESKVDINNMLGAEFQSLDKETAKNFKIPGGVKVMKLNKGKLAETEIKEGFIITRINEKSILSVNDLILSLKDRKGGVLIEGIYEDLDGIFYYAFGI